MLFHKSLLGVATAVVMTASVVTTVPAQGADRERPRPQPDQATDTADLVLPPTNLTVVRHDDSTLWAMRCYGVSAANCSAWTSISGRFTLQPTLTWDPTIRKFILVGVGNNRTSIWRSTFQPDGTWNNDWTQVTGASPSPVAIAGGPIHGPYMEMVELDTGALTIPTYFDEGPPLCTSSAYTPTVTSMAKADGLLSAKTATANTLSNTIAYSTDGGTTWQFVNGLYAKVTTLAGGWVTAPMTGVWEMNVGTTYLFSIMPETPDPDPFSVSESRCHLSLVITDK